MDTDDHTFSLGLSLDSAQLRGLELKISLARLEAGQRDLLVNRPDLQILNGASGAPELAKVEQLLYLGVRQAIDVQAVVRGIRNVLHLVERQPRTKGPSPLGDAEAEFRSSFPAAWDLRDILEHLPDYVVGKGNLQKTGAMPADGATPNLVFTSAKNPDAEILLVFNFEQHQIEVKAAARKAIEIAELLRKVEREGAKSA